MSKGQVFATLLRLWVPYLLAGVALVFLIVNLGAIGIGFWVAGVFVIAKRVASKKRLAESPSGATRITQKYIGSRSEIAVQFEKQSAVYFHNGYAVESTSTVQGHRSVFKGLVWTPKDMLIVIYKKV